MTAEYEPTDLQAADQRQHREALSAEQKLAEEARDWRFLMSSPRGRRIVWSLLEKTGVYRPSFVPDALQMAFNEGQRNVGLTLLAKIGEHAPDTYLTMQTEAK